MITLEENVIGSGRPETSPPIRPKARAKVFHLCLLALFFSVFSGVCLAGPFLFELSSLKNDSQGNPLATLTFSVPEGYLLYRGQFSFSVSAGTMSASLPQGHEKDDPNGGGKVEVYDSGKHDVSLNFKEVFGGGRIATFTVGFQGCSSQTCFMPDEKAFSLMGEGFVPGKNAATLNPATAAMSPQPTSPVPEPGTSENKPEKLFGGVVTPSGKTDFGLSLKENGLIWTLLLAFLGGFLVSFTPCVYPMIPITLSIIGGRDENTSMNRGFLLSTTYVAGLSLTYALLGLLVAFFGAHIRGIIQGAVFQTLISIVFLFLALSMFDVFLLQFPSSLRQRLVGVKHTGFFGIFFMGMVSGLMASPCVAAPLAGILAFIAASGNAVLGFLLLLSFSWGMGLILIFIGTFSGSLNSLPKAGEWMEKVKEFYGFLLLGAALYFAKPLLGTAVLNLAVSLLLAAFAAFLGVFSTITSETPLFLRVLKGWGMLSISVAVAFAITAAVEWGGLAFPASVEKGVQAAHHVSVLWHENMETALQEARNAKKLVFVDFRADWCAICRELEERVFPDHAVQDLFEKMVLMRFDTTANTPEINAVLKKFNVVGLPTLIVLRPDGTEMEDFRVVGAIGARDLAKNLQRAINAGR